jgi:hypothetical protein
MYTIYVIQLPQHYSPRIMAFHSSKKAREICDALNEGRHYSASGNDPLEVYELSVYEDSDIFSVTE